ncbi:MAG: DinB family protein [Acidobacteria bacterium]|nr:DinB family protein [Acidobacteriota bacterium]
MSSYVCPECGLDYDTISPADAAVAIRSFPRRYREVMTAVDEDVLAQRPAPEVWSAVEYASHVAQLYGPMADAQRQIRIEDHPQIRWERLPDPPVLPSAEVLADLGAKAEVLAAEIDATRGDDWQREGTLPWGDRDALTMARNAVHEGSHHLRDIERGLAQLGVTAADD